MAKFKITYTGQQAKSKPSEVIEADSLKESGHEGEWMDFFESGRGLVLRVRADEVGRIERVSD